MVNLVFKASVYRTNSVIDGGFCITCLILELLKNTTRNCISKNNGTLVRYFLPEE